MADADRRVLATKARLYGRWGGQGMTVEGNIYRKHNSFSELLYHHEATLAQVLKRIERLRESGDWTQLSSSKRAIVERAFADLLDEGTHRSSRFSISPNVAAEIHSLEDAALASYLVHRYRYEIFPQTQEIDDFPPYLQIEPSSICNYRCIFCFETDKFFTRKSNGFMGHMSLATFQRVIDQAVGNVEFISLASRGEPLICPEIEGMLAYTRDKFLNLKLNTNASLLDESKAHAILQSGVKTLVFSADAADEPLYSQLRVGGNLDKVLANIERFQKIRLTQYSDSRIITRVSGVKVSAAQNINAMQQRWGSLVDQVAFVNYNPWENVYECLPTEVGTPCSDLWRRMCVWWDGKANPCDVDYRSTLSVGSLDDGDLSRIWRSESYERLRNKHRNSKRRELMPCNRCSVV